MRKLILIPLMILPGFSFSAAQVMDEFEFLTCGNPLPKAVNLDEIKARIGYPCPDRSYEGFCVVKVLVDTNGEVADFRILKSPLLCATEKVQSEICNLRFEPLFQEGTAVKVWVTIPFRLGIK